jgi:subtilisin family serine protease
MKNSRAKLLVAWVALTPLLGAETVAGRYIVELTTEPVTEHVARVQGRAGRAGLRGATASSHRARLRQEQAAIRRGVESRRGVVLDSVDTVANALFVEAPDEAAAQLAALPGVKRVFRERRLRMTLDRAAALHRVADAWNLVGEGNAGAGVKIGIIDSGIDSSHEAFKDASLTAPDTYPRVTNEGDLAFTSGKIIVARSYVYLVGRDPDSTPRDRVGHGTALAMAAAGVRNAGPLATITGMAPKAYLGNYKVFGTPNFNDTTTDSAVMKAIDDAVADGMDIINLSLGSTMAARLDEDPEVQAIERAFKAGVIVVVAAGNNGPDLNTISSPATAPSAITVGATTSDRTFAAGIDVPGVGSFRGVLGNALAPAIPVSASVADVSVLDGDGLGCSELPADSLKGRVALILRGTCTFESKLNNAQAAGAVAGLIYATPQSPDPIPMFVGAATLPAQMISNADGVAMKEALASQPDLVVTIRFLLGPVDVAGNRLTGFTAKGPSVDNAIKPDLVALGGDVYTATQTLDANGDMYDPTGYTLVDGTSFSAPLVAGVAALIKSARPGLTPEQYRSLIINTAADVQPDRNGTPGLQQTGAGLMDAEAAIRSTITAYPASLGLGTGGADPKIDRNFTIGNVGTNEETLTIHVTPRADRAGPALAVNTVQLAPGAVADIPVSWTGSGLLPGAYEGFIEVRGASSGTVLRVPYWYAVTADAPASITVLDIVSSGRRGSLQRDALLFRVIDAAGVSVASVQPEVTVEAGGGEVLSVFSYDADVPGMFGVDVRLGLDPGRNAFRVKAGEATLLFAVTGQ